MGTTLTGTTPQDTYDALIKVGDNGIITGSLKTLSDGEGHDTALALSTGAASVTGTLAVSGNAAFDTNTLFVDAANNRVGVGTITPSFTLDVNGALRTSSQAIVNGTAGDVAGGRNTLYLKNSNSTGNQSNIIVFGSEGTAAAWAIMNDITALGTTVNQLSILNGANVRLTINSSGNLGIGTDAPAVPLDVVGNIRSSTGILFGSDTAAANALDDYEEGTFTPTIIGSTTAGTATYGGGQQGNYTKIGRIVYFSIYLGYSGGTGTGDLRIAGLPFTIASSEIPSFSIGTFLNVALTASNVPLTSGVGNSTQVRFDEIPTGGGTQAAVPYDASAVIAISGLYQV